MLIPIGDDDRALYKRSYVTTALLVINVIVFVIFQGGSGDGPFTWAWAAVPFELTTGQDLVGPTQILIDGRAVAIPHAPGPGVLWLTVLTSMFMHGGFAHLAGNLLYLWIFGDNVEHRFGHRVFLLFYLASGIAATAMQVSLDPGSIIPTLGASGAISGVLGAYLVLFPRNRVQALLFVWILSIPAAVAIGAWIVFQIVSGWSSLIMPSGAGGVAYGAHIGGFAAGVLLALILRVFIKEERPGLYSTPRGKVRPV